MFRYLINDEEFTFSSVEERDAALIEAANKNYSVQRIAVKKPDSKETSKAPESAFSQIMQGESPEDFITDPAESADAVSETAAQEDTELQQAGTFLDLPEEQIAIIEGIEVTKQEYDDYQTLVDSRKDDEITDLLGGTPVNDKPVYGRVLNENGEIDFIEEPYEDQMRNYKNTYLDAITASGNFAYLQDKSPAERKYLADKMVPKPTLVKKQYNQQTDKYELVPTADATAMVKEALPSNFSSYNTPEQFDKATDVAIAKVMQEDPILQFDINVNIAASRDKMAEVVKKLQEKYDTSDPVQYEKAVKEYNEALNELVLEPVYNSPTYKNTRSQLYKVIDEVAADNKKQFGRSKDAFLSYVDRVAAQKGGESSTAMVLTESVYKGIKMMQGDFNRAQVGFVQDNLKEAVGGIGEIEKGLKDGNINLNDKAAWGNVNPKTGQRTFSGTVEEKLAWLKKEQKKAMDSIVFDLEEAGEVDKYVSLFNAADLKDGISFDDMTMLLGESLPQMTAAIAGTTATTLTGNPMFAALGFMSMFTTEYGANYIGAIEQGLINDKIEVTDENIIKALEEGKYANQATAVAGAAISAGLEQVGGLKVAKRTLKALNLGENIVKGSASLYRGEIKKIIKQGGRQAFENVKSGLGEALTEVGQTVASQVTLGSQLDGAGKYLNFEEIKESAIAGGALGFVLPFGGNVMAQSRIELRNAARTVATRFDFGKYGNQLKAVNGFFKKAETNLKDKLELNEITEEEYQEELEALNLARTTGFKLPKNLSETSREKAFDLLIEKQKIQNDIEGIAPEMVGSQKDRIKAIDVELDNIATVDKMNKSGKSLLKSADSATEGLDTEYISVGSEQEIQDLLEKKGYNKSIDPKTKKEVDPADAVKTSYGAYGPAAKKGEKPFVIINEQFLFSQAKEGGKLKNNTAAHEILHKVLQDVMTPEQRINLGTNLLQAIQSAYGDVESFESSEFGKRFKRYQQEVASGNYTQAQLAEEVFTVLGEAMLDGDIDIIKENVGVVQRIKDLISDAYKAITGKPIEFNTEDDLFKFISDYNKSVIKGKGLSKSIKATIKQGAKGKLAEAKGTGKVESLTAKGPSLSLDTTKSDAAYAALEEAEALRAEDYDNPTLAANVDKAEAAFFEAQAQEQNALEDAETSTDTRTEATEAAPKEKIQRPKADKSKRRYSLDTEVKKELEPKIAKAQAMNKKLIAQEKELNKKLIADIEAIPDKEVKRTEKDKRIAALKNNPRRVPKPSDLNKLEKEIAEALKIPIDKAVNLFTRLYYDRISDNAKTAVTREEFKQSARAEITSITINEFKPETINRQGESIINDIEDIVFQRGGLRLRNLAERLGVVGKDQGIARGAEALTKIAADDVDTSFGDSDVDSVTSEEKRKVSALLAGEGRYNQAKEQVQEFWKENEGNTKVENFKKLPNLINNILSEMFGVNESTLAARSGNLNKDDYRNAIEAFTGKQAVFTIKEDGKKKEVRVPISEVGAFQDKLNEQRASNKDFSFKREANESIAEALIRFLPKTSADDYVYASGRKGRFSGKSTGLPKNLMGLAYKVESRKTTGIGNVERTAQKLTIEEIYEAIGATVDADGNVVKKPSVSGRDREGQTLLGLIKLTGRMVTNELSRTETDLDPMTKEDLAAGKNDMMFSLAEKGINLSSNIVNSLTDQEITLLAGITNERNITAINNNITDLKENSEPGIYARLKPFIDNYKKEWESSQKRPWPAAEQKIIDVFKDLEKSIPGLKIIQTKLNKDSSKLDYTFKIDGKEVNLEVKKNLKARLGSLGIHFDAKKGYYLDEKYNGIDGKYRQKLIKNETEITQESLTEAIALYPNDIFVTYNTQSQRRRIEVSYNAFYGLKKRGWFKESQIKTDLPVAYVSQYYAGKKGDAINFGDVGLFNVGNKNAFQAPNLEQKGVNVSVKTYWRPYFKKNDRVTLTRTATPELSTESQKVLASQTNLNLAKSKEAALLLKTNNVSTLGNQKLMPKMLFSKSESNSEFLKNAEAFDKAITLGNSLDQKTKGISVWDFDDTLATTKSSVLYTMPDGTTGKIDAATFAKEGDAMLANGAKFDFSEFSKVVKGAKGPFFEKAMARNKKFGNENVYILTARPANSALAIHEFLKGIGLDIPLANITGLANSDPQAKANWVVNKFAEGYNDFYFADDHIGNVKAVKDVLSVLDVKSKVQQARISLSTDLNKRFNEIIEEESGIEDFKKYQSVKAGKKGATRGKFKFFIPPSAEDFLGLLYTTLPKGKKGESAMAFYKEHLLDPYGKAVTGLRTGRITIAKNYKALKKELGIVPRKLKKRFKYEDENGSMKESLFTKEEAIRVYTWDAQGFEIPGLSNVDLPILVNYVNANPDLKAFADKLLGLNKNTKPTAPKKGWDAGTITSDLLNTLNTDGRKQLLEVWQQNVDAIFSETNLNKLEAAYGESYVRALKDSLKRMKTGRNSTPTGNTVTDGLFKWINAAVGNIMFLNRRSAALQLISFTNFINFEGNNIYQAGKAFANQKQYWKDWVMLMNSDYLVDRRDGLRINVNEADIATTAKENGFQGVLAKILQFGFIPTKMADTAAIATGGASFYRNKVNALIKDGMSKAAAEKQAMQEFISTAETSQQSSDPSKISKQQAEPIGRIILAFANTPSQYARIIKRAAQDLKNGRGDAKTHLSRIVYYGLLQNLVFNFLQQAMFTAMMGDDDEEELTEKQEASQNKKMFKVANSMTDGILRGIGLGGAVVSTVKNLAIKLYERSQKDRNQNMAATALAEVMKLSPPISSKLSKVARAANSYEWEKKEMEFDKMSLKHPYITIAANTVAAATGFPADRAVGMAIDAVDIASDETETWMKPLIALGWPKWQLMSEEDTKAEREEAKERFKGLEDKAEIDALNPEEKRRKVLSDMSKAEQELELRKYGLLSRDLSKLSTEGLRVDKIMEFQNKEQFDKDMELISEGKEIGKLPEPKIKSKKEKKYTRDMLKRRDVLRDLKKQQQIDTLRKYGLKSRDTDKLRTEDMRITKIIEFQDKKRKNSLK